MSPWTKFTWTTVCVGLWCVAPTAEPVGAPTGRSAHIYLQDAVARFVVERAVGGAARRLRRADCLRILNDFPEFSDTQLWTNLRSSQLAAGDFVIARMWFVDGADDQRCRRVDGPAAFTAAGNPVIHICGERFAAMLPHPIAAEVLIVHEFLHTLGLGENPPSSGEITRRVRKRCGGS